MGITQQNPDIDDQFEFTKEDNWFKDKYGRYVIFRGINFAQRTKLPPYLPLLRLDVKTASCEDLQEEISKREKDLTLLKELGFNIVRLLVIWKAIEPSANQKLELLPDGEKYLRLVKKIIDHLYYKLGIYTIIDFHQDIAHENFGGDGFPDWTIKNDLLYFLYKMYYYFLEPEQIKKVWFVKYSTNKLVRRTLKDFWENREINNSPVRTHFEKTVLQAVTFFSHANNDRRHPGILGYELFNEPYQVNSITKKEFETNRLNRLYSSIIEKMKIVDSKSFIFIEPRADWNLFPVVDIEKLFNWVNKMKLKLKMKNIASLIEEFEFKSKLEIKIKIKTYLSENEGLLNLLKERGVFSFHYYDPKILLLGSLLEKASVDMKSKDEEWTELFNEMNRVAVSTGCIPFITEFGANHDWKIKLDKESEEVYKRDQASEVVYNNDNKFVRAYIDLQYRQIERLLLNSTYWVYDLYNTEEGNDNWNLENFSILGPDRKLRHEKIMARPYPMRSSAKPELLFFDLKSKLCTIMLNGKSVDEPTLIFIPSKIQYNSKFQVFATIPNKDGIKDIQKVDGIDWNIEDQILSWYPDKHMEQNQIVIARIDKKEPDTSTMPDKSRLFFNENKDKFENFKIDGQYLLKVTE